MRPRHGERGHLEQSKKMSRGSRVDDDALETLLLDGGAEETERVELIDAGRGERQQVAQDVAVVRDVETLAGNGVEERVDPAAILVAKGGEGRGGVHLAGDQLRRVGHRRL